MKNFVRIKTSIRNVLILCCALINRINQVSETHLLRKILKNSSLKLVFFLSKANGKLFSSPSPSPPSRPTYVYTPSYYYYHHGSGSNEGPTYPDPALPAANQQDKDDAAAIVNGNFDEKTIATILPFRPLDHRKVINNEIANIHKGVRISP